jgi:hypothetical protein
MHCVKLLLHIDTIVETVGRIAIVPLPSDTGIRSTNNAKLVETAENGDGTAEVTAGLNRSS